METAENAARTAPQPSRVVVVLAGAGARGAYEAGVMSIVLPRLAEQDVRPELYVGTSAGAINATLLAAHAHRSAGEQAEALLAVWRGLTLADVIRPVLLTSLPAALRGLGQLAHIPGVRLTSLLDTTPLQKTAARVGEWGQLRTNIDAGRAELAVVATAGDGSRTVVFVDRRHHPERPLPGIDSTRGIEYCPAEIDASHVRASAAIPVLFPPVRIESPPSQQGWYLDGGVRLNAPLKPALALGADALVVVATHPVAEPPGPARDTPPPDVDDALVALIDVAMADRMVEDVRTLAKIDEAELQAERSGGAGRKLIPYLFFGPERRGRLGELAAHTRDARPKTLDRLWHDVRRPDLSVFGWLAGGDGARRGDLLSYLSFEPRFIDNAITLGQRDARRLLGLTGAIPWLPARSVAAPAREGRAT